MRELHLCGTIHLDFEENAEKFESVEDGRVERSESFPLSVMARLRICSVMLLVTNFVEEHQRDIYTNLQAFSADQIFMLFSLCDAVLPYDGIV